MTFKTTITDIELVNRALGLMPEAPLPSMDAGGAAGRAARRWYKPVVGWLLERHHWNLAIERVPLTPITNTRTGQWRYAYQKPADAAYIVNVMDGISSGVSYYEGLRSLLGRGRFNRVGNVLYSDVEGAFADITSYQVTEADFDETFCEVIVLHLASRFAVEITKKQALRKDLEERATNALLLAIAQDKNENNPTYGNEPTDSEIARGVGMFSVSTLNYPISPVQFPIP